ncbi:hypothetical protein PpBr36_03748 [Pyricularia pennisetigena]|uniref:hypothetical protein n=1 Tax=Pyricularia pennisetigena TaxID=1578925 RepID=UPI00114FE251|nr:hypothetical protein PpBr36_03748 [Pyricularia pennisetigena]TLS31083.1 hypothetical protein PpBr36_03748 [Pyricularia pennisetigena]
MILSPRSRRPLVLAIIIGFFFIFLVHRSQPETGFRTMFKPQQAPVGSTSSPTVSIVSKPPVAAFDDEPSPQLVDYWTAVLDAVMNADPEIEGIKLTQPSPAAEDMDPNVQRAKEIDIAQRIEHVDMPASDRAMLKSTHAQMVKSAKQLGPMIPYTKNSKGIVMTAGGKYVGNAILSLTMLRRTGSKLPVQLFIDGADNSTRALCEGILLDLGVECRSMDAMFGTTPHMPELEKFQYKVFSLLFSSFDDVLFLDADCYPLYSPDHLFDVDPYKSYGLVTWPDLWISTVSPTYYEIAGVKKPPTVRTRRTSESGVFMIKRSTHAEDLLLATYYNFFGPEVYYRLFSQGGHGEGDKETFLHAAIALDKPFWDVHTVLGFLGRWLNGTFEGVGMKQADPVKDFNLWKAQDSDHAVDGPDSPRAPHMFIHFNNLKVDIQNSLNEVMDKVLRVNGTGHHTPLWGDESVLNKLTGYDIEKVMWEEVIRLACTQPVQEGCDRLIPWYQKVFLKSKKLSRGWKGKGTQSSADADKVIEKT